MNCIEAGQHIHAYMDGELDLLRALAIEGHFVACAACRKMHAQHASARIILHRHATCFTAPASLRARVRLPVVPARARGWRLWLPQRAANWPSAGGALAFAGPPVGAALAFAVIIAWTVSAHFSIPVTGDRLPEEIVSSHVRSLMSGQLADIESSDRRAVKPWLSGRLDYSPPVDDLAADGYALVGGRIDYVRDRRVAALVYRHQGHPINVFVWPATEHDVPMRTLSRKGYNLVNWRSGGLFFCAVSDLDHSELAGLARLLQRNAG